MKHRTLLWNDQNMLLESKWNISVMSCYDFSQLSTLLNYLKRDFGINTDIHHIGAHSTTATDDSVCPHPVISFCVSRWHCLTKYGTSDSLLVVLTVLYSTLSFVCKLRSVMEEWVQNVGTRYKWINKLYNMLSSTKVKEQLGALRKEIIQRNNGPTT